MFYGRAIFGQTPTRDSREERKKGKERKKKVALILFLLLKNWELRRNCGLQTFKNKMNEGLRANSKKIKYFTAKKQNNVKK